MRSVVSSACKVLICVGMFAVAVPSFANTSSATDSSQTVAPKGEDSKVPNELLGVGVKEHLGEVVNSELEFTNATDGKKHKLKDFFQSGKPTLLNLVYYECPMLCTMVLNGVNDGMKGLDWTIGNEFNVLTISINPKDDVDSASAKRDVYIEHYLSKDENKTTRSKEKVEQGWQFLTGSEDQIKALATQLGFEYKYDEVQKQYAHPAVTFVLTPEGKVSRYLYGVQYRPRDLRLALLEASQGKIGNVFDRLLMFCYHYEPSSRGYTLQAVRLMQAGGVSTVALLGGFLTVFWTRQRKGKKK